MPFSLDSLTYNTWPTCYRLSDGRVEAYAAGPAKLLEDFEARLRQGPPAGDVRGVEAEDCSVDARIEGFDIR